MKPYSEELKAAIIEKLLPPQNTPVGQWARETGIPKDTLYPWRAKYRQAGGVSVPAPDRPPDPSIPQDWSAEDKFAVVRETAALSEAELSAYCRRKGLYGDPIEAWKQACRQANGPQTRAREEHAQRQAQARRIQPLEAELRRQDPALAEAAALWVLTVQARLARRPGTLRPPRGAPNAEGLS
jgi:transposase-like protein